VPLLIKLQGPISRPVVICDHCNKEITDAQDGNYQWLMRTSGDGVEGEVYFTHKSCCDAFESAHPPSWRWGAMELDCLLVYLANNLKVDWEKAARKVAMLDSIG